MEKNKEWQRLLEKDHCFIIAEAASNHNGDLGQAKKLVDIAADAGADAVKFQFYLAEKIAADTSHEIAIMEDGDSLQNFYRKAQTPREWIPELFEYCKTQNIMFLATPFDFEAVDLLDEIGMGIMKIASFEIVDIPLLKKVAQTQKPVILSTGMADMQEIQEAIEAVRAQGNSMISILHCGINYPVPFGDVNLRAMDTIREQFGLPVGYSDHTAGITVPVAAVARGARIIEKHFTISRDLKGPDHFFSIEPDELKAMVKAIRECEACLGGFDKHHTPLEKIHYQRGRRSVFARRKIFKGEVLCMDDFAILRPGVGLKPKYVYDLIGQTAKRDWSENEPIDWRLIKDETD